MAKQKKYSEQCRAELNLGKSMSAFCVHEDGRGHYGEHKFSFTASDKVLAEANVTCNTCKGLGYIKLRCEHCEGTGKGV